MDHVHRWAMGMIGLCVHIGACGWAAAGPREVGGWSAGAFEARDQFRADGGGLSEQPSAGVLEALA